MKSLFVYLTNYGSIEGCFCITIDGKGICKEKTLEGFDFSFNPKLNTKILRDPWNCSFIVVVAVNGLVILMVPGYITDLIKGIILLLAIVFSGAIGKFVRI
jgi:hypothetical protein